MAKLEDIFSGTVELTARQRAFVSSLLSEWYTGGSRPDSPNGVNRRQWVAAISSALLGPLKLAKMVSPDGTEMVTPEEHHQRFEGKQGKPRSRRRK